MSNTDITTIAQCRLRSWCVCTLQLQNPSQCHSSRKHHTYGRSIALFVFHLPVSLIPGPEQLGDFRGQLGCCSPWEGWLAGMIRKSNSSSGGGGTKRSQALHKQHSKPHTGSLSAGSTKTWDMGRNSKNSNPLSTMGLTSHLVGASGVDPEYVMQLVNDVRWFADVLHNLKEAFHCKGEMWRKMLNDHSQIVVQCSSKPSSGSN